VTPEGPGALFYVGAMDGADEAAVAAIRGSAAAEFGAEVRVLRLPGLDFAYDHGRKQYGSIPALQWLARICPSDASKLLAVTERDLFIPVLTFVYGQAQLGGRVAVVSLARLRQEFYGLPPNRPVLLQRAVKEALHEAGHLFGLAHCKERECVMSLATNVRQIDSKGMAYCARCGARVKRPGE
jgi:archaemetzincin